MLPISMVIQITIVTSIASAIVTPSQLYEMVDHIVDYYINDSCLVVISSGGYTAAANYVSVVYVDPDNNETLLQGSNLTHEESYKMNIIAPVLELGCTGFLVQTENPGKQLRLIEKTFVHVNQRTQRRFIFIPTIERITQKSIGTQDEVLDLKNFDVRSVLQEKSVEYIPDMIFAFPNDEVDRVALVTHRFTGPSDLSHQEMLLDIYDVAKKSFQFRANLFSDKIKDLEGKILKVAMFHYPPYAVILNDEDQKNHRNNRVDGTEWRFAVEFARFHNCSLEEVIDNDGSWGHIYENLTGEGVTGNLVENRADLGMSNKLITNNSVLIPTHIINLQQVLSGICTAALYSWYYESLYLDLTAPFYRSGITCLVPGPRQLPQWMSPIRPFAPTLWAAIIGMTIVSTIFIGMINRVEVFIQSDNSTPMTVSEVLLTVAGISLLQGLRKEPNGPSWAALSITLLIVSVLLSTGYGSSLSSAMTVPRYGAPINSASELATSGILWAATHEAWIFSILTAEEQEMRTLVKNFRELSFAELTRHSTENKDWAFSIERLQSGHYSIQDYLSNESVEKMHLMKGDIYWEYCVSMLRKSSPFTRWYSQRILEIQASGIPAYWETDVVLRYLDTRKQLAVNTGNIADIGPVKMTVTQVQGTFFILVMGLALSCLVFLGELYTRLHIIQK